MKADPAPILLPYLRAQRVVPRLTWRCRKMSAYFRAGDSLESIALFEHGAGAQPRDTLLFPARLDQADVNG